jgi:hypothetical protein
MVKFPEDFVLKPEVRHPAFIHVPEQSGVSMATQHEYSVTQLLPLLKTPASQAEFTAMLSKEPALIDPVGAVVRRYESMPVVSAMAIEMSDDSASPPIRIVIDTTAEGSSYDQLQDDFWDWWLSKYAWAARSILVALW